MLNTIDLTKSVAEKTLCNSIDISVKLEKITGLFGPNGAGKSTFFHMISGLIKPSSGEIILNNASITRKPMYQRAQLGISFLPQDSSIFSELTVYENIFATVELHHPFDVCHKHSMTLIEKFQLEAVAQTKSCYVSGGERRRTEIARACANNPSYLLLDEPFAGVDPLSIEEIKKCLRMLADDGIGIFITDHNVKATLDFCDYAYVLLHGRILAQGDPESISSNADVLKHYLGYNSL